MPDPVSASTVRPLADYDELAPECSAVSARPEPTESKISAPRCTTEVAAAAITCARAAIVALEVAPTVVGGLVASFVGGLSCGGAVMRAAECLSKSEGEPR